MKKVCGNCEFFRKMDCDPSILDGYCQINAPVVSPWDEDSTGVWPIVCSDDFCGEWRQAEAEPVESNDQNVARDTKAWNLS
jgi:hypothetical protein